MRAKTQQEPAKQYRRIIADTARSTRTRLVECRLPVAPQLHELVNRREVAAARQLVLLTDEMVMAYGEAGAVQHFAEMGARLVSARKAS
jgi:hypothetical protein